MIFLKKLSDETINAFIILKGLPIKNFIEPKLLLERAKKVIKIYLKKIKELKQRVWVDIGEEYV